MRRGLRPSDLGRARDKGGNDFSKDGWIGQDYLDKNIPVVYNRLSMASVRLTALLNAVFDETRELLF